VSIRNAAVGAEPDNNATAFREKFGTAEWSVFFTV
jgi:hypothetical protein